MDELEKELLKELAGIEVKLSSISPYENHVKYNILTGECQGIELCLKILKKYKEKTRR